MSVAHPPPRCPTCPSPTSPTSPTPPSTGRPLLEFVGTRTYGTDHPDRHVLDVRVRLDPTLDAGSVLGRLVEAVRDLDVELRAGSRAEPRAHEENLP